MCRDVAEVLVEHVANEWEERFPRSVFPVVVIFLLSWFESLPSERSSFSASTMVRAFITSMPTFLLLVVFLRKSTEFLRRRWRMGDTPEAKDDDVNRSSIDGNSLIVERKLIVLEGYSVAGR